MQISVAKLSIAVIIIEIVGEVNVCGDAVAIDGSLPAFVETD